MLPTSPLKYFLRSITLLLFFLVFTVSASVANSSTKIDLNELIKETQKSTDSIDELLMVWWIPTEFWRSAAEQNPSSTPEQIEELVNLLNNYTIVLVIKSKIGILGAMIFTPRNEIAEELSMIDGNGTSYTPLTNTDIAPDAQNFVKVMKPIFSNMLGSMGENMNFFLFPSKNKNGDPIVSPKKEGTFNIVFGKYKFKWRLPLGSLLPPHFCSKCKATLSGAYKYCPYDGKKLTKE